MTCRIPLTMPSASLILRQLALVGIVLVLRALYTARTLVNVGLSAGNINPPAHFPDVVLIFTTTVVPLGNQSRFENSQSDLVKTALTLTNKFRTALRLTVEQSACLKGS